MIEIKMKVDEVDYERALETLLPLLAEHFSSKTDNALISGILSKTKGLPVAAVKAMLKTFPQETKDELAVFCLNYYGENISHILTDTLEKQGISLKVQSVEVKYQGEGGL